MWSHVLFVTAILLCILQLDSCNTLPNAIDLEDGSFLDRGRYLGWLLNRGTDNKETKEVSNTDRNRFISWLMNRGTDSDINVDGTPIDKNRFLSWFLGRDDNDDDDKGTSHSDLIAKMKSYSPKFQQFFDRLNELLDIFETL